MSQYLIKNVSLVDDSVEEALDGFPEDQLCECAKN